MMKDGQAMEYMKTEVLFLWNSVAQGVIAGPLFLNIILS
jgi:hypothetical protein